MKRSISLLVALGVASTTMWAGAALAEPVHKAFAQIAAGSAAKVDHAQWDRLLKTYVQVGADGINRVAYARFKAEAHDQLKGYIAQLEGVTVATLDRSEQFAFWANLYNAKTIEIVLQKYPVASIKDISLGGGLIASVKGGPWAAKVVKVSGQDLSLDDIEHGIMRRVFKDPRVHYAVNCAALGCPNLIPEAFVGERLEQQLDAAARAFINSSRGARNADGRIQASSIYNWFQSDFGGNAQGVVSHLQQYAEPELKQALEKSSAGGGLSYEYDWRLNDAK